MKCLNLSRLWMLIGIIILTTGQAWAQTATTQKVFTSIKELRDGAQTNGDKHDDVVVKFEDSNPATVVAVMKNSENDYDDEKFVNSFFIVDNSNYGLWVSPKGVYDKNLFTTWNLKIGTKITGSIIGDYRQNDSGMPYFGSLLESVTISGKSYKTALTINRDGEASEDGTKKADYPWTKVDDVSNYSAPL